MKGPIRWPLDWTILLYLPALLMAFTVHELAHALVAYLLGDTSQVERQRLSLNPLRHISWWGMAVFLLFGFGWARPVWVDVGRFRIKNPPFGMFLVSIAGAGANFLTALAAMLGVMSTGVIVSSLTGTTLWEVFRFLMPQEPKLDMQGLAVALSTYVLSVNLILGIFNLLPLPPLDGFQAIMSLFAMFRGGLRPPQARPPARPAPLVPAEEEAVQSPAEIHFRIGLEYHKAGHFDEAIARYRQAISHDNGLALAYYNQGLAYLAKGRSSLAANAFRAALQSGDPDVAYQAELRLRELVHSGQSRESRLEPLPPPLEPGAVPLSIPPAASPLDPAIIRRMWWRLGLGGAAMFFLGVAVWFFVTGVVLMGMQ